jgi:hypothetical protein
VTCATLSCGMTAKDPNCQTRTPIAVTTFSLWPCARCNGGFRCGALVGGAQREGKGRPSKRGRVSLTQEDMWVCRCAGRRSGSPKPSQQTQCRSHAPWRWCAVRRSRLALPEPRVSFFVRPRARRSSATTDGCEGRGSIWLLRDPMHRRVPCRAKLAVVRVARQRREGWLRCASAR